MKPITNCLMAALLGIATSSNAAPPSYAVTDLGLGTAIVGINNSGEVLAYDFSNRVAVYRKDGWIRQLDLFPTLSTTCSFVALELPLVLIAGGINNHGAVVFGAHPFHAESPNCIVIYSDNALQLQSMLGDGGEPTGINDAGQIVGQATDSVGLVGFGPECDFANGGNFIDAVAINDSEQILGRAVGGAELCTNGVWHPIPVPKGAADTMIATAINNRGEVVGYNEFASPSRAILYSNGTSRYLETFTGGGSPRPQSINVHGQIVGTSGDATTSINFLYDAGKMYELAPLISATDPYKNLVVGLSGSASINDAGVIASAGTDSSGAVHLYILTPIK
jgi:probable HAF family extracellular repeat protein